MVDLTMIDWRSRHIRWYVVLTIFLVGSAWSSTALIWKHLRAPEDYPWRTPTIRILLMVPVYSFQAYFATVRRLHEFNEVLEWLRKVYECIAIVAFAQLLVTQLGGIRHLAANLQSSHCRHLIPVKWIVNEMSWTPPRRFIRRSLGGLLQYIPVSLITALISITAWIADVFPYIGPVCLASLAASQALAMYCLVAFCHANQEALAPIRPIRKLLSIKILVFFTMWQTATMHFARRQGAFTQLAAASVSHWDEDQLCEAVINGALVAEMFLLSLAHHFVHPCGERASLKVKAQIDFEQASFAVDSRSQVTASIVQPRQRYKVFWRILDIVDFRDILLFHDDLARSARTTSADVVLRDHYASRFCCWYVCHYFSRSQPPSASFSHEVQLSG